MPPAKVQTPANSNETETVNALELTSINALVSYTAYDKKVSEAVVRHVFSSRFGVDDIGQLPRNAYEDAIRFLIDVQLDMMQ